MVSLKQKHNIFHYLTTIIWIGIRNLLVLLIWSLVGFVGFLVFKERESPWDLLVGLPLMLIGVGFIIHSFWTIILTIFSPIFNKVVCAVQDHFLKK